MHRPTIAPITDDIRRFRDPLWMAEHFGALTLHLLPTPLAVRTAARLAAHFAERELWRREADAEAVDEYVQRLIDDGFVEGLDFGVTH